MTSGQRERDGGGLAPDAAFAVLGNETRMEILQALGEAEGAVSFSDLYDVIEYDTTANFSYHLEKLEGHFVRQTDAGYMLTQSGKRIVKAVLSGAVTDAPVVNPSPSELWSCPYCGAPVEIGYNQDRLWLACPECPGTYGTSVAPREPITPDDHGFVGYLRFPPAGLTGRSSQELFEAGMRWGHLDFLAMAGGVCPWCAARVERTVSVCGDHDSAGGLCSRCDSRHAVQVHTRCTNCIHEEAAPFVLGYLIGRIEYVGFLADHGINPVAPSLGSEFHRALVDYEEEVLCVEPLEAKFTLVLDDESLTVTVDEELSVVDAVRRPVSEGE